MTRWLRRRQAHLRQEDISGYVDGELSAQRAIDVLRHLRACEQCLTEAEELRSVKALVSRLPRAEPVRSFALTPAQAGSAAARSAPIRPERPRAFTYAPAVAMTLFVALVAVDLALVDDGGSRTGGEARDTAKPAAESLKSDETRRSLEAAAAPAPALSTAAAAGAAQADRPTAVATPSSADFARPSRPQAAEEADSGSEFRPVVRILEVLAAGALILSLIAFLRPSLLRRG